MFEMTSLIEILTLPEAYLLETFVESTEWLSQHRSVRDELQRSYSEESTTFKNVLTCFGDLDLIESEQEIPFFIGETSELQHRTKHNNSHRDANLSPRRCEIACDKYFQPHKGLPRNCSNDVIAFNKYHTTRYARQSNDVGTNVILPQGNHLLSQKFLTAEPKSSVSKVRVQKLIMSIKTFQISPGVFEQSTSIRRDNPASSSVQSLSKFRVNSRSVEKPFYVKRLLQTIRKRQEVPIKNNLCSKSLQYPEQGRAHEQSIVWNKSSSHMHGQSKSPKRLNLGITEVVNELDNDDTQAPGKIVHESAFEPDKICSANGSVAMKKAESNLEPNFDHFSRKDSPSNQQDRESIAPDLGRGDSESIDADYAMSDKDREYVSPCRFAKSVEQYRVNGTYDELVNKMEGNCPSTSIIVDEVYHSQQREKSPGREDMILFRG